VPPRTNRLGWGLCELTRGAGDATDDRIQYYATQTAAKSPVTTGLIYLIGYIKLDSPYASVFAPSDQTGWTTTGSWATQVVGVTGDTELAAVVRAWNTNGNLNIWLKEVGSADVIDGVCGADIVTFIVGLDASEQLQYWQDSDDVKFYIEGTLAVVPTSPQLTIDTGTTNIDTGTINIDG